MRDCGRHHLALAVPELAVAHEEPAAEERRERGGIRPALAVVPGIGDEDMLHARRAVHDEEAPAQDVLGDEFPPVEGYRPRCDHVVPRKAKRAQRAETITEELAHSGWLGRGARLTLRPTAGSYC